ncbi:hypothetical protein PLESTF_000108500 [Pleodorina starrii]|nr:hypothetical protein PLESTF_000108500 [Pleodorina starrii]
MLKLRLPSQWAPLPSFGQQPDDEAQGGNLMPPELCASSFARACAARRALQQARASSASACLPPRAKKPRLPHTAPQHQQSQTAPPDPDADAPPADAPTDAATSTEAGSAIALASSSAAPSPSPPPPPPREELPLLLTNCRVLDVEAGAYLEGLQRVLVRGGVILEVQPVEQPAVAAAAEGGADGKQAGAAAAAAVAGAGAAGAAVGGLVAPVVEVDCGGAVLMPGLCDAHVHCTAVTANLAGLMSLPESYVASKSGHILAGMLARGFTTIRDAGGADFGLAQAADEGLVLGPRVLFTGHALSQTGGHGDFRGRGEDACACGAALRGIGRVCDGDTEVRRAARDELRRGAHCIKIMASGGVASPTDRLTNTQFSEAELTAIVEEAAAAGTYVCAHAYTPAAIQRAVRCGVASIEHGNYLDEQTALLMSQRRVFLVPTLVTYQEIVRRGAASGMPQELVAKVGDAVAAGLRSLSVAAKAGVRMCFGSDLLGDMHPSQAGEFELRARVLPPADILRSATVNCATLFGMQKSLGQVRPGYRADLLLLRPGLDPLEDVTVLAAPGGAAVAAVFKDGLLAKAPPPPAAPAAAAAAEAGEAGIPGAAAAAAAGAGVGGDVGGLWEELNGRLFPTGTTN